MSVRLTTPSVTKTLAKNRGDLERTNFSLVNLLPSGRFPMGKLIHLRLTKRRLCLSVGAISRLGMATPLLSYERDSANPF